LLLLLVVVVVVVHILYFTRGLTCETAYFNIFYEIKKHGCIFIEWLYLPYGVILFNTLPLKLFQDSIRYREKIINKCKWITIYNLFIITMYLFHYFFNKNNVFTEVFILRCDCVWEQRKNYSSLYAGNIKQIVDALCTIVSKRNIFGVTQKTKQKKSGSNPIKTADILQFAASGSITTRYPITFSGICNN
jgi:hypothetical protein